MIATYTLQIGRHMKIAITGSQGLIGSELVKRLENNGHEVIRIVRSPRQGKHVIWDPKKGTIDAEALEEAQLDAVIHLAGEGIAEKKWSDDQKREILESRTKGTRLISETISNLKNQPSIFISASAIGFYGSKGDIQVDETSKAGEDFLASIATQWEENTKYAGIPTAIIRTGIVLSNTGGVLQKMLMPFKLGIGGRFGDGKQYMSWISMEDEISAIIFILENKLEGIFNLTAPNPVTNEQFTKALGKKLSRPTILPTPMFPLKLKFGGELVDALMLGSQRVLPKALWLLALNSSTQRLKKH